MACCQACCCGALCGLLLVVDPVAKGLFMARAGTMACFERRKLLEQQSKSFIY